MFRRTSAPLRPPNRESSIRQPLPRNLFSASASPSPVRALTPVLGAAATASSPCSRSLWTTFEPMSPVPPITTIFIIFSFISAECFFQALGLLQTRCIFHGDDFEPPSDGFVLLSFLFLSCQRYRPPPAYQAAGSMKFCAEGGSTGRTRTWRRFVRKSNPHCSNTKSRLANPMRK